MKYLVTGAAGFVGSTIVDRLISLGHEVIGVDNFSTGHREYLNIAMCSPHFNFVELDLKSPKVLDPLLCNVDAVYHMAANADIRGGLHNPFKDIEENTIVTFNVLESMRICKVSRIIFASSAAALGEPKVFPTPEDCSIPSQTSLYGASKMSCEGLISAYCEGYGFEGYVFRFVSLLGPRYPHGHVFDFVRKLLNDSNQLEILGNGLQRKSYLHIDDCVDALMHICECIRPANTNATNFEIYHLGCPEYCEVKQSALWIAEEMNITPNFRYTGGDRGWVGDNPFVFLDITKAKNTGWSPSYSIEDSIRTTTRWLLGNKWIFS